jgi:hypothetical protein
MKPAAAPMVEAETSEKPKAEARTFAMVPAQAMSFRGLKRADWCVLCCLSWYADATGYCWPAQDDIARMTKLSRQTVSESIQRLMSFGLVEKLTVKRKEGKFKNNTYRLRRKVPRHATVSPT